MGVPAADPNAAQLDEAFAGAMGAAPRPKEPPPPPETDRDAPHGRDDQGTPLAPYGLTKEGRPKLSPAGRKPAGDDKPRTADQPGPAAAAPLEGKVLDPKDYCEGLAAFGDAVWLTVTMAGKLPLSKIPFVPARTEVCIRAQATLFRGNQAMLVNGFNIAAQHSPRARRWAEKLDTGDMTWALACGAMMAPFALQSVAMWQGKLEPELLEQLAARNEADLDAFAAQIRAMVEAAQAQAGQEEPA